MKTIWWWWHHIAVPHCSRLVEEVMCHMYMCKGLDDMDPTSLIYNGQFVVMVVVIVASPFPPWSTVLERWGDHKGQWIAIAHLRTTHTRLKARDY
jgi:hypothetical protein